MKLACSSVLAVFMVLGTTARAQAPAFDVRVGQWEMTIGGMAGQIPGLEALPPEQRAKVEAEMRKPHTDTNCITADDLKDLNLGKMDDDDDCKVVSKNITRTTADFTRQCTGDEKRTDVAHIEAVSRESIRMSIKSTGDQGAMTINLTGKWLGPTCQKDQ
jgi:hypothetical protein